MFKRIDHIEIIPVDLEKSLDFYLNVWASNLNRAKKWTWGRFRK
jgi:catechol 2,3-dioxygenase-like lactoylglutathione lyase family enzyme